MNVLVTGGAGYIGSITVEELVRAGDQVIVFDNLVQGHRAAVHPEAVFVHGDLADRAAIDAVMAAHRPDAVMHFASHTLVGESMRAPMLYLRDNVMCGLALMDSAVQHGVGRIVLSSTANLFGAPTRLVGAPTRLFGAPTHMPIDEHERVDPGSPYGESKHMLERCLHWLERVHGCRYACLRYFNACGASAERGEDHDPETHLIPLVLQVALGQREHITIFGSDYGTPDGTCVRDYVHVVDLARAHVLALRALDRGSRTYNLGVGRGYSVQEVIDTARAVTGHPIPAVAGPRRAGDPDVLVASSERIRRDLGWQPAYPELGAMIESAWRWHRDHPSGYGDDRGGSPRPR